MDETKIYNTNDIENAEVAMMIKEIAENIKEKGYNPINQIVGYLVSDDPGYISSYKGSRKKIVKYDRTKIIEVLVKEFIK